MTEAQKALNARLDAARDKLHASWAKDGLGIVYNPERPEWFGFGRLAGEKTQAEMMAELERRHK